jgi:uncharacterized protein YegL
MAKINHIAFVIDKSGSMEKIREQTISNINEQLDVIQDSDDEQEDFVTVVTFNGKVSEPRFISIDERFTEEDYVPRGNTALIDAVGATIDSLQRFDKDNEDDTSFLVVILSDGYENASKKYRKDYVSKMINKLEDKGNWTFTFIGADKSCIDRMVNLGVKFGNSTDFVATTLGASEGFSKVSKGITSFKSARTGGQTQTETFYKDSN